MKLGVAEILDLVSKAKTTQEKVDLLRKHHSPVLANVLKMALDPTVEWDLPKGEPPYKPNPYLDQHSSLYAEARRLYLFLKGGNTKLTPLRRETLFIQLIENLDPADAKVILAAKDKKVPYKGINVKLIDQAYPGLLTKESEKSVN